MILKFDPIRANSMIKTQGRWGRGPGDDRNDRNSLQITSLVISVLKSEGKLKFCLLLCDELVIVVGNLPKMARAREPIEKGAIHRWQWETLHKEYKRANNVLQCLPNIQDGPMCKDQPKVRVR